MALQPLFISGWEQLSAYKGFMKASVISKDDHDKVESAGHEIGNTHDAGDWSDDDWK